MLFFENLNRDFGTLGKGLVKIGLQIRTRRPRIRSYANFCKFGYVFSLKNNQLACFFGHPVFLGDINLEKALSVILGLILGVSN